VTDPQNNDSLRGSVKQEALYRDSADSVYLYRADGALYDFDLISGGNATDDITLWTVCEPESC